MASVYVGRDGAPLAFYWWWDDEVLRLTKATLDPAGVCYRGDGLGWPETNGHRELVALLLESSSGN